MKRLLALLAGAALAFAARGADYEKTVSDLIPRLADPTVENRYAAQMDLQAVASASSAPGHAAERAALGQVLAARAADASVPQPARVWIVRQLEYMGAAEAVDALGTLLSDPDAELRECARRALEKNPAPAASGKLRDALAKASDARWRIGLINSLGQRHDAEAVSLITPALQDEPLLNAAAMALGRIASPAALQALWGAVGRQSVVSDALILACNQLVAEGKQPDAAAIFAKLYQRPETPAAQKAAALVGLAKADPATAEPWLAQALQQDEPRLQTAAISAMLSAFGNQGAAKLAALLPKVAPPTQLRILAELDASTVTPIVAELKSSDESVRLAALEALGRIGGAEAVSALEATAAAGEPATRAAAINTLATRGQTAALPTILKCISDADTGVRRAAFAGVRLLGGDAEIEPLGKLVVTSKSEPALAALTGLAERVKDKPAAAHTLLGLAGNNTDTIAAFAEVLSVLGGDEALAAVSRLAASGAGDTQETAVRALGNWSSLAAAGPLLTLATNSQTKTETYALAEQGLVTLVKSADSAPMDERVTVALSALAAARRDAERKLALSALAAAPHARSAAAIQPLLADPNVKSEAALAAISVAEGLSKTDPATAKQLATAVKTANVSPMLNQRANRILRF